MLRFPTTARIPVSLLLLSLTNGCSGKESGDDTDPRDEQEQDTNASSGDAGSGSNSRLDASRMLPDAAPGTGDNADASRAGDANATDAAVEARSDASSEVRPRGPSPRAPAVTVTGPISGGMGKPFTLPHPVDFATQGYLEEEFFFEGNATAYSLQGEKTMDGRWDATANGNAAYKTRLVVRRPQDAARFNGTVVVEWLNVSAGFDTEPGFQYNWEELFREGYAWVGVSAQSVGIEGGGIGGLLVVALALTGIPDVPNALKAYDADRYGTLVHPGDAYSFDIFTQAAQLIRDPGELDVLGGLSPERLIAYGESQSAGRMRTYVNAVHPLVKAFDGFFIHRGAFSAALNDSADWSDTPDLIRTDLAEPIMNFLTETDVFQIGKPTSQPDDERLRTWEVAGTSHADAKVLPAGFDLGCGMINDGPQHFVIKAALHALNDWTSGGPAPAHAEPYARDSAGSPMFDEYDIILGGVRTPDVDVPIATYKGLSDDINPLCGIFGVTIPFTPEQLKQLYPTHEDYVTKVGASARAAREAGFLLSPEEQTFISEAEAAKVPE